MEDIQNLMYTYTAKTCFVYVATFAFCSEPNLIYFYAKGYKDFIIANRIACKKKGDLIILL